MDGITIMYIKKPTVKPFEKHGIVNSKETVFNTAYIQLKGHS